MNAFAPVPFLPVGELLRYRRLGSVATYRARASHRDLVELEEIEVPGLKAGRRFMFARDAVAKMERVPLKTPSRRSPPSP